jgi:hypothetical protein
MLPARLQRPVWLTALGAMFILAACGAQPGVVAPDDNAAGDTGGDTGGGGGDGSQLCSTISAEEVGEIVGGPVTATETAETDCDYTLAETDLINVRYESSFDANLETARLICDDGEEVSGVGDMALWCPGVSVLYFNKGDRSLAVQLVLLTAELERSEKDIATEIARRVADSL